MPDKYNVTMIETFFNFQDAAMWIERHLEEFDPLDWSLEQCSINLQTSGAFRAGVSFVKRQKEMWPEEL